MIQRLLKKNSKKRLGSFENDGFEKVKNHSFFKDFDWDALYNKTMEPPLKPDCSGDNWKAHFDDPSSFGNKHNMGYGQSIMASTYLDNNKTFKYYNKGFLGYEDEENKNSMKEIKESIKELEKEDSEHS